MKYCEIIQGSLDEWLRLLRLEEYGSALEAQGYSTIDDVTQLTWEDLEDIGIVKLGHQKRLLLAIKRVKDIKAGKSFVPHSPYIIQTQVSKNYKSKKLILKTFLNVKKKSTQFIYRKKKTPTISIKLQII